uniref:Ephrin-A3 n=1 Tax=Oncorhynchus tshawytscha TaxID=74940 RepID=A0AAZ3QLQ4_ONCTS
MALATVSLCLIALAFTHLHLTGANDRHAVYWNSSNLHLRTEGYTVQVAVNDYLDIYCPHYNTTAASQRGTLERLVAEQYVLYMVSYRGYRTCDPQMGFKRWECNRPHAPHAPIKFSEKFQRYSAFSLGYEFNVGHEYYYISTPTHHHGHSCLRLRVYVCCSTVSHGDDSSQTPPDYTVRPNIKIHNIGTHRQQPPSKQRYPCRARGITTPSLRVSDI